MHVLTPKFIPETVDGKSLSPLNKHELCRSKVCDLTNIHQCDNMEKKHERHCPGPPAMLVDGTIKAPSPYVIAWPGLGPF
jgi:hypothetical protein